MIAETEPVFSDPDLTSPRSRSSSQIPESHIPETTSPRSMSEASEEQMPVRSLSLNIPVIPSKPDPRPNGRPALVTVMETLSKLRAEVAEVKEAAGPTVVERPFVPHNS